MNKDLKILVGIVGISVAMIGGMVYLGRGSGDAESYQNMEDIQSVQVNPTSYSLGDVEIDGGVVGRAYQIKNSSDKEIEVSKLATSCMCTKAKIIYGSGETRLYGMEGQGNRNPNPNVSIKPNETVTVIAEFDPAAHGPQGVGPFDRSVWVTFSNPNGVKELTFSGTVVN